MLPSEARRSLQKNLVIILVTFDLLGLAIVLISHQVGFPLRVCLSVCLPEGLVHMQLQVSSI